MLVSICPDAHSLPTVVVACLDLQCHCHLSSLPYLKLFAFPNTLVHRTADYTQPTASRHQADFFWPADVLLTNCSTISRGAGSLLWPSSPRGPVLGLVSQHLSELRRKRTVLPVQLGSTMTVILRRRDGRLLTFVMPFTCSAHPFGDGCVRTLSSLHSVRALVTSFPLGNFSSTLASFPLVGTC